MLAAVVPTQLRVRRTLGKAGPFRSSHILPARRGPASSWAICGLTPDEWVVTWEAEVNASRPDPDLCPACVARLRRIVVPTVLGPSPGGVPEAMRR